MPIEIRELIIRAYVNETPGGAKAATRESAEEEKEKLVQACLDQVERSRQEERER